MEDLFVLLISLLVWFFGIAGGIVVAIGLIALIIKGIINIFKRNPNTDR